MKKLFFAVFALTALSSSAFAFNPQRPVLPEELKPIWASLQNKKGTPAYNSFIATRNYVEAVQNNVENPPAMPKTPLFNWDYVAADEAQTVTEAVVNYYIKHPTAMA